MRLVGMCPADRGTYKRVDRKACSLTTEVSILIDEIFPGTTWTAWFVTLPELFATGAAVLETCACTGAENSKSVAMTRFIG